MPDLTRSLLRATTWLMLVLGAAYAITLVPGIGPSGWTPAIDGWLNMTVNGLVIVVLALHSLVDRRDRAAWLFMTAGLVAAFAASTAHLAYYQYVEPVRSYTWSDVGYLLFYVLLAIGLFLRLRTRARRLPFSLSLDGLIAGLTAAALAETYVPGAEVPLGAGHITSPAAAYPVADLLLLALTVATLAILGVRAGWSWWLLCASFVVFFVTDAVYADLVAQGAWVGGGPVDVGWLLARLLLVAAALVSRRSAETRTVNLEGASVLVLPGVCGLAVLALLYDGIYPEISQFASVVALCAGVLMVGRTALTFRELRELTEARQRALSERLVEAQDDERARIASDVHDDSIQALAAVDLRLGALRNRLRDRAPDEAAGVETAIDAVHGAGVRLRSLLFELETPVLDAELADGLRDTAAQLFEDSDVGWSVEERGRSPPPAAGAGVRVPDRPRGDGQRPEARAGHAGHRDRRRDRPGGGGAGPRRREGNGHRAGRPLGTPPLGGGGHARPGAGLRWPVADGAGSGRRGHRRVLLPAGDSAGGLPHPRARRVSGRGGGGRRPARRAPRRRDGPACTGAAARGGRRRRCP